MQSVSEVLQVSHVCAERKLSTLAAKTRELVVQAWHTPQAMAALRDTVAIRTQLGLSMDPSLLRALTAQDATAHLDRLCTWLREMDVEFEIGYRTCPSDDQQAAIPGHLVSVRLLARSS